jgi:hypothetical protein
MKRRLLIALFILITFIFGWLANDAYSFIKGMKKDRFADFQLRPTNVPKEAFWAGGVDGGNWYVVIGISPDRHRTTLGIYNDQDGSLIISKSFQLVCSSGHSTSITNLKAQISGFDGEKVLLRVPGEYCYLK